MNKKRTIQLFCILAILMTFSGCFSQKKEEGNMSQEKLEKNGLAKPSFEEIGTQSYPNYYNREKAESKGLASNGELNINFQIVHNMYKRILGNYLLEALPIEKVDTETKNSSIYLPIVPDKAKEFYQKNSGWDTQYIYLRNNIYVERLSQKDIDIFLEKSGDPNFESDSNLKSIVEETFLKIIKSKESDVEYASYDRSLKPNALNEAVVLEIAYQDEYDEVGNSLDGNMDDKRLSFLSEVVVPNAEKELSENNETIPVSVLFTRALHTSVRN